MGRETILMIRVRTTLAAHELAEFLAQMAYIVAPFQVSLASG
jgi:hypothetical protein